MRIKIQALSPVPYFKAWFSVLSATNIHELKSVLCTDIQALKNECIHPRDIVLTLQDFELLDASPIDVVRDGDLIIIKRRHAGPLTKRKAPVVDEENYAHKRPRLLKDAKCVDATKVHAQDFHRRTTSTQGHGGKATKRRRAESSPESDSDSSSSSSSSSNTSTSTSTSSGSSSSSDSPSNTSTSDVSESSTSSAPSAASVHLKKQVSGFKVTVNKELILPQAPSAQANNVPPGLGKPATHNRNIRRRRKRLFERLEATVEPASVNEIPLGTRAQTAPEVPPASTTKPSARQTGEASTTATGRPPVFMMSTLQNKNKKKGFKKMMNSTIPAKITFSTAGEEAAAEQTLQEAVPFTNTEDREIFATYGRLVPPSEKQEKGLLPLNMFVTSVDVEAGLPRKKQKKRLRVGQSDDATEDVCELPYDDPENTIPHAEPDPSSTNGIPSEDPAAMIDRQAVEARWASLPKLSESSQLAPGMVVGWKELGINPQTFTPEMLLNVGHVVSCEQQLVVEQHPEHVTAEVSFGGLIVTGEEQNAQLGYEWADVFQGDWRHIQTCT